MQGDMLCEHLMAYYEGSHVLELLVRSLCMRRHAKARYMRAEQERMNSIVGQYRAVR